MQKVTVRGRDQIRSHASAGPVPVTLGQEMHAWRQPDRSMAIDGMWRPGGARDRRQRRHGHQPPRRVPLDHPAASNQLTGFRLKAAIRASAQSHQPMTGVGAPNLAVS
jgi:hypothetical protein